MTAHFQAGTNTLDFIGDNTNPTVTYLDVAFTSATASPYTPTLASVSPSSVVAGAAATTVTLTGTNFTSGLTTADFNGVALATTVTSSTTLTAVIPATDLTTAGTDAITAVSGGSGGVASAAQTFTVDNPVPTLTGVSPSAATTGASATTVTLTGTGFVSGSTVDFNGTPLTTTYVSPTELTAVIPASDLATAGTDALTVVSAGPGGGTSAAQTFTVDNPVPTLTGVSPSAATTGASAATVTLTGIGFVSGSTVDFNGTPLTTTYVSPTELTAVIPASDLATAGTDALTVVSAGPGGGTSAAQTFTVNNPTPTEGGVSPGSIPAGSADTTVTVTGTNFVSGSTIDFNGVPLATTYVSPTELTAVIPASDLAAAGTAALTVVTPNPGGTTSAAQTLTITNPVPTLAAATPGTIPPGSADTTVTLTGTGFVSGSTVDFNGTPLTTTYVSPNQLTAVIPASDLATAGSDALTVVTPGPGGGTSSAQTLAVNLTYLNPAVSGQGAALAGLSAQQRDIQALYLEALGRPGSVAELNGYLAALNGPNGQAVVAQAIEDSPEGRDNLVKGWYQTYLGRAANGTEEMGYVTDLLGGMSEEAVLGSILSSPEFFQRAQAVVGSGTPPERFVEELYAVLLGRTATAGEIAGHVAELAGGLTQTQVATDFLKGPEFRTDEVELYYATLLGRTADPAEVNDWANTGLDVYTIRQDIENSPEYFARGL